METLICPHNPKDFSRSLQKRERNWVKRKMQVCKRHSRITFPRAGTSPFAIFKLFFCSLFYHQIKFDKFLFFAYFISLIFRLMRPLRLRVSIAMTWVSRVCEEHENLIEENWEFFFSFVWINVAGCSLCTLPSEFFVFQK